MSETALRLERRDETAAHQVEQQFRQLLDALPVGAYTCDADGLITYYNAEAVELWGRAPKLNDPVDRWCGSFALFNAADGTPLAHEGCWMALALRTGQPHNRHEIIIERPNGQRLTGLAHANPLRDPEGRLIGAVNVLVDISDRKRSEEALSRIRAIVESSDDAIISKTLEGKILTWNRAAERIFGHTAEEAVGKPITLIIPAERQLEERDILARLRRGERIEHYETVRVAKDGTRLDISLTSSPVHDAEGRVIGASKVARDITLRKRDEKAMRLLHEMSVRLATALDVEYILRETLRTATALQDTDLGMISVVDASGNAQQVGASLGIEEGCNAEVQAIESCFEQREPVIVVDVEVDQEMAPFRAAARRAGIRAVYRTPLITRSGKVLGVLSTYFRQPHIPTEREKSLVNVCARQAVDFIENARLYVELQEADRAKNNFLATLAHELRNPLAPIRNTVETLHLTEELSPAFRSALGVIDRQLGQMTRLIDDLMDVSRITNNKLELRRESIDLADVLHAAVEASRPALTARGHDFGVDLPPEPLLVDGDPARLAQIVSNLLNNAAKYTPHGGRVRLAALRQGGEAVIVVRDTGIGIAPEAAGRIFEMFAQVDRSLDSSQGGLGIGLHLARRLAEMHGGTLSVTSAGPGQGSEFTLRLPVGSAPPAARQRASQKSSPTTIEVALRILVVDDNRDSADSLGRLLRLPGHHVFIAYDGLRAVELAEEHRPDVVVLDIGLPKLDGYQTAQRIRAQPWGQTMALIALTGWGQEEAKQRSKAAGFDAHIVKPVDPSALLQRLKAIRSSPET